MSLAPFRAFSIRLFSLHGPTADFTANTTTDPESSSTPSPELIPEIELVYPSKGCTERFVLLQPKQSNEYHPIQEVLASIGLMVDREYLVQSSGSRHEIASGPHDR